MLFLNIRRRGLIIGVILILLFVSVPTAYKIIVAHESKSIPKPEKTKEEPSPYGEFLRWEEVNTIFPKYSKATVIDFETGLQFHVQRRAGKYHADVQPLASEDSSVMKMIYDGSWSWKRKAVIVKLDNGRRIAASMNGMPHGAGAIRGNNFNGHFCIHFRDSKIHASREINMDHQIMIWKAANKVDEQLFSLPPRSVVNVFFSAVAQNDGYIAGKAIDNQSEYAVSLLDGINDIKSARLCGIKDKNQNSFDVDVWLVYEGSDKEYRKKFSINMIKKQNLGWKIDPRTLLPLIEKDVWVESRQYDEFMEEDPEFDEL
ncbi:N-acetylmuramoyl-L-alanine amidase [Desulfocucumis palustris]|uniref:N-acetylmuramoyl-L-alanine amidase n=1 Tax=Desulfocucumis palustris TaxID=1898651 RepID=A0A2L2XB88_9FIRM|nr:hypothetical protein [Desulfocucumis palustris]GBF33569.1 N-acetylmuramoyl-L-alanine amidase [Desulfocucumis palustris]